MYVETYQRRKETSDASDVLATRKLKRLAKMSRINVIFFDKNQNVASRRSQLSLEQMSLDRSCSGTMTGDDMVPSDETVTVAEFLA